MDVFTIIVLSILAGILLIANIYLFVYYSHPDDDSALSGVVGKLIIIIAMSLSWIQILLLPLDVSNSRGGGFGFSMTMIWTIFYIAIGVFVIFILPLASAYNECDEDWTTWEKLKYVMCSFIVSIVIFVTCLAVSSLFLAKADIPIHTQQCTIANIQKSNVIRLNIDNCTKNNGELTMDVGIQIYLLGAMCFVSWFVFVIFGGIGIAALPLDCIYEFSSRPKIVVRKDLDDKKIELSLKAKEVKTLALQAKEFEDNNAAKKSIFTVERREYTNLMRHLKASYSVLNREYQIYKLHSNYSDESVVYYCIQLILGILFSLLSLIWFSHIILYFIVPYLISDNKSYEYLNLFLLFFTENNLSFISTGVFAVLCVYLLVCVVKGFLKFGTRFLCCVEVHPLVKNETYMNSIIFNVMVVLTTSISVTQFCASAFSKYATMTDIEMIFSNQIKYLRFYRIFFENRIFEYALLSIFLMTFVYLMIRPNDKNSINKKLQELENEDKLLQDDATAKSVSINA